MIGNDWDKYLKDEFEKDYFKKIIKFLEAEYAKKNIFPAKEDIFKALEYSSFEDTKIIILGQDPYYNKGQAQGLAFSVNKSCKIPPSLRNIYKELEADLGIRPPSHGSLVDWARQGVLLLNTSLTVEEKKPNSHSKIGWEVLTDKIISLLDKKDRPCVFMLWGNNAKDKEKLIKNPNHLIIKSSHPSPLSARRGFFGSRPFSRANKFLKENNLNEIEWQIEN